MKQINFFKLTFWLAAHVSWLTMAFSPIAYAKQNEALAANNLKMYSQEFGLNKKTTLKEFWEKSKYYFPGYAYEQIEELVKQNPNAVMPEVQIKTSKASDGTTIPVMYLTENGKTQTVQFHGEANKYIKYNGTVLTENEAQNFDKLVEKLQPSAKSLKKSSNDKVYSAAQLPQMNKQLWKKMTLEQRVGYMVQLRLLYSQAQKIISMNQKSKKTSSFPTLEMIFKSMLKDAEAADEAVVAAGDTRIADKGYTCIVAGYVTKPGPVVNVNSPRSPRPGCSVDLAMPYYQSKPELNYVVKAQDGCKAQSTSLIACNPIIYGYPNGSPICIERTAPSTQIATQWPGPCDEKSRLTHGNDPVFQLNSATYPGMTREQQVAKIRENQAKENFKLTKDFIEGILKSGNQQLLDLFKKGDWSQALEDEIRRIGGQFNAELNTALQICEARINQGDAKFKLECDQLHRRALFIDEVITGLKKPEVVAPAPVVGETESQDVTPAVSACDKPEGISGFDYEKCLCKNGKEPTLKTDRFGKDKGTQTYKCGANWLMIAGIGLGILALFALLNRDKKPKPPRICPPGTTGNYPQCVPVVTACPPGQIGTPPNCQIVPPLCEGAQVRINDICQCANTCGQGIVQNPISCTCEPAPTEGGSGDNTCENPPCNGGVPTGN